MTWGIKKGCETPLEEQLETLKEENVKLKLQIELAEAMQKLAEAKEYTPKTPTVAHKTQEKVERKPKKLLGSHKQEVTLVLNNLANLIKGQDGRVLYKSVKLSFKNKWKSAYINNDYYMHKDTGTVTIPSKNSKLITELEEINESPEKVLSEYGKEIGSCCFCGRTLSDEDSISKGYGPTCGAKYNIGEKL